MSQGFDNRNNQSAERAGSRGGSEQFQNASREAWSRDSMKMASANHPQSDSMASSHPGTEHTMPRANIEKNGSINFGGDNERPLLHSQTTVDKSGAQTERTTDSNGKVWGEHKTEKDGSYKGWRDGAGIDGKDHMITEGDGKGYSKTLSERDEGGVRKGTEKTEYANGNKSEASYKDGVLQDRRTDFKDGSALFEQRGKDGAMTAQFRDANDRIYDCTKGKDGQWEHGWGPFKTAVPNPEKG